MKRILGALVVAALADLPAAAAGEIFGWGPVPFGATVDGARNILDRHKLSPDYRNAAGFEFLSYPAVFAGRDATATYRFLGNRLKDVLIHAESKADLTSACEAIYDEMKRKMVAEHGVRLGDDHMKTSLLVTSIESVAARIDGVGIGLSMDHAGRNCVVRVRFVPPGVDPAGNP